MNYYEILNVDKNASESHIKKSYKELVKHYHPDLYNGDKTYAEEKIKEINKAYDTLSDKQKKLEYDEYLYFLEHPSQENENNDYSSFTNSNDETTKSYSEVIVNRFSLLNSKRQLQIIIAIVIIFIALFLINLIQVKYYLSRNHTSQNIENSSQSSDNDYEDYYYDEDEDDYWDDEDDYEYWDDEDLNDDNYYYNLNKQLNDSFKNWFYNEYNKTLN